MSAAEEVVDSNSVLNAIRDDIGRNVPRGWQLTTLGACFKWSSGGTPKRTESSYFGGEIPWAVIGDLNDGVVSDTASTITAAGLENSTAKWAEPGSVLVAMYGSIGKLGIAGRRVTTNQAIAFTDPRPVEPKYLYYFMTWQRPALFRLGKGATQMNISQTVLKEFPFLLAGQVEQRSIVAELDKQFSRLDKAAANLERVKAKLKRYKASVIKAAIDGKLVDLSTREQWMKMPLAKASEVQLGQQRSPIHAAATEQLPYIRAANVTWDGLDLLSVKRMGFPNPDRYRLQVGDVLLAEASGSANEVGKPSIWNGEIPGACYQKTLIRIRARADLLTPRFVLLSPRRSIRSVCEAGTGSRHLASHCRTYGRLANCVPAGC